MNGERLRAKGKKLRQKDSEYKKLMVTNKLFNKLTN